MSSFWEALRRIVADSRRTLLPSAVGLVAFGVLIPRRLGMDLLDIRLVMAYAFIPMLFVGPAITNAVRTSRNALFGHLAAIFVIGWMMGLLVMALSLATINYTYGPPELLLPESGVLTAYAIFSFSAVAFVASFGAYMGLLFSPTAALTTLRLGFVALLLFFYVGTSKLPMEWQMKLANAFNTTEFMQTALLVSGFLLLFALGLLWAMRRVVGGNPSESNRPAPVEDAQRF